MVRWLRQPLIKQKQKNNNSKKDGGSNAETSSFSKDFEIISHNLYFYDKLDL